MRLYNCKQGRFSYKATSTQDTTKNGTATVTAPSEPEPAPSDDYTPAPDTVFNDPSALNATVWLTGEGLGSSDLLITERDPEGSAYQELREFADGGDVFATYNIYLKSGRKSTGNPMELTFDLSTRYAGQDFTLVHQKADVTYEYFYDTADSSGDLTFGPLYEFSPFMLAKGRLTKTSVLAIPRQETAYSPRFGQALRY